MQRVGAPLICVNDLNKAFSYPVSVMPVVSGSIVYKEAFLAGDQYGLQKTTQSVKQWRKFCDMELNAIKVYFEE